MLTAKRRAGPCYYTAFWTEPNHVSKHADKQTKCAEHGVWTNVPTPAPAGQQPLDFSAIDADENQRIISSER
jgi:hypothetical protein